MRHHLGESTVSSEAPRWCLSATGSFSSLLTVHLQAPYGSGQHTGVHGGGSPPLGDALRHWSKLSALELGRTQAGKEGGWRRRKGIKTILYLHLVERRLPTAREKFQQELRIL